MSRPKTSDLTIPLEAGYHYHLFNKGNNGQNIFYKEDNYRYFLSKYATYLSL